MAKLFGYQKIIHEILVAKKRTDIDPRHVESFMRLQYSTLDHLSQFEFELETEIGIACVDQGGRKAAERNAKSFGL